jgi:SAM-dependent methyltransferase
MLRRIRSLFSRTTWRAWHARRAGLAFDQQFGTDTQAPVGVNRLGIPAETAAHAVQYEPSTLPKLRRALRHLDIDPPDYVFVDVGSGKGLVVIEAARSPFREVIGIEISRRLHETATDNLARARARLTLAAPVTLLNLDALAFDFPDRRQVVYLYNPFDQVILRPLLCRLVACLEHGAEDIVVVYVNPVHRPMLESEFDVEVVYRHATLLIYRLKRSSAAASPARRTIQRSPR